MRFLLRLTGYLVVAVGFVILIIDGLKTISAGALFFSRIADLWQAIHYTSLQNLQPLVVAKVGKWLWDPVILTLLLAPASLALIGFGGLLMSLGRSHEGVTIGKAARR